MNLWNDGRSGPAGCFAGNLVLSDLEKAGDKIAARKGTTFTGKNNIFIGRVCATDDYLQKGLLHWANISHNQHRMLASEANRQGKELCYLFITGTQHPAAVHYWKVPSNLVEEVLLSLPVKSSDESCAVRICEENGKEVFVGDRRLHQGLDVTQHHHKIVLGPEEVAAFQKAFETAPSVAEEVANVPSRRSRTNKTNAVKPIFISSETGEITAEQLLTLNKVVRSFGGADKVRRALEILDDLKKPISR